MGWETVNKSQDVILRATRQQTATGLLWQPPSREVITVSHMTQAISRFTERAGIGLRRFTVHNRSGSTATLGIGFRLANPYWGAGQFTSGGVFADDTADAQDAGTSDFAMGADATNDGFVIWADIPFSWFSINVGAAEVDAGGGVDHAVQYSDVAGTGWTALGTGGPFLDQFTLTNTVIATGAREFLWTPPADWGKVVSLGGIPVGKYAINVTSAGLGVGDTTALATAMEVGTMIALESFVDNGIMAQDNMAYSQPLADGVVAYFSTANAGNSIWMEVTTA